MIERQTNTHKTETMIIITIKNKKKSEKDKLLSLRHVFHFLKVYNPYFQILDTVFFTRGNYSEKMSSLTKDFNNRQHLAVLVSTGFEI